MQSEIFVLINTIGILAFAFAGSMRAIKAEMDVLGIITLGIVTALGGGVVRDLLVNKVPYALSSFSDMAFALFGVILAAIVYKAIHKDISNTYIVLIPDALGVAVFTLSGALVANSFGLSVFGWIILSTTTAVGGGLLADICCCRVPSVLKDDFYASCAVVGALLLYALVKMGVDIPYGAAVCCISVFGIRMLAIAYKWRLPKITYRRLHVADPNKSINE